ncbi:uncharacterized protein [Dermacentor albipictus]|uniref:uncharacterized protein n=1 Tax=Dermacentor albipictus TaxID=60249 RepID=UPI0038FC7A7E
MYHSVHGPFVLRERSCSSSIRARETVATSRRFVILRLPRRPDSSVTMVAAAPTAAGKAPALNVAPAAAPVKATPAVAMAPVPAPAVGARPAVLASPHANTRGAESSKMHSDVQVLMVEQSGDMAELGSYGAFNICCNLFMGACIGATTVLLVMFFFTDCRFVMTKKNVDKNKSRAGIEELDSAAHLGLAGTTLTVLALEDATELPSAGEESSPEEAGSSTPREDATTKGVRKRPATVHAPDTVYHEGRPLNE